MPFTNQSYLHNVTNYALRIAASSFQKYFNTLNMFFFITESKFSGFDSQADMS